MACQPCIGNIYGVPVRCPNGITPAGMGPFNKNVCPLKSFCDPGLANNCGVVPIVNPFSIPQAVPTWRISYLVSNKPNIASHLDPYLMNPWGIVIWQNQLWVVNGTTDVITNYDLFGNSILAPIIIRDATHNSSFPTGIAVNCGGGFSVASGVSNRSAQLIVCSEHGTVSAFNPTVDSANAYLTMNRQFTGRVHTYKGLAIANNTMYLADFFGRKIDVFDSNYLQLFGFNFVDDDTSDAIPLDYGPNNIVHIGYYLFILYAKQDPFIPVHDLDGPGNGFVSVFNLDGSFVRRFTSRGVLNSPWAMIPAPCTCGLPPGSYLIGNNGDGKINIFDADGLYIGPILAQSGLPMFIEGLWGLAPHYMPAFSEIYFASSAYEDDEGVVGCITPDQIITF